MVSICSLAFRLLSPLWKIAAGGDLKTKQRSPDEAQRSPGVIVSVVKSAPDCHPGYMSILRSIIAPQCAEHHFHKKLLRLVLLLALCTVAPLSHAEISINPQIDTPNPWVREEILLTVEVSDDRSILEQKTAPWAPPGVSFRTLNASEERVQTADGIRILRRQHWAIMPLYAGELKLQPPGFEVRVTGQGHLKLTPDALKLNVRPLNPLLPTDVPISTLQIKGTQLPAAVQRGRPFNLNFSILGSGLSARGLRHWLDESLRSTGDLRIYPPDIRLSDGIDPAQPLLQQADIRLTFESQASGQLALPSIVLPYVNPQDGNIQHAILPASTIRIEHPLWLALRPWLPWGMSAIALIVLLISAWKYAHPRWQAARQRRAWLRALQAADSPKALHQIWHQIWQHIPATPGAQALAQQLDAACYGSEPVSASTFSVLKTRLIEHYVLLPPP